MMSRNSGHDEKTGLPKDMEYLEKGLSPYLEESIAEMEKSWQIQDSGGRDYHWDCYWCALYADINSAETENEISHSQASYLRKKYLRMEGTE